MFSLPNTFIFIKNPTKKIRNQKIFKMILGEFLGKGREGEIYSVKYKHRTGYCIKKVDSSNRNSLIRTQKIYDQLKSKYIVPCHGVYKHNGSSYLLMNRLQGNMCDFIDFPEKFNYPISELDNLFYQVALGLNDLKKNHIFWGDCKLDNILVDKQAPRAYLCDIGSSIDLIGEKTYDNHFCTQLYKAPEVEPGNIIDYQADVFSFGVCMYVAKTQTPPFNSSDEFVDDFSDPFDSYNFYTEMSNYQLNTTRQEFRELDHSCQELLENCLKKNPAERWTIEDVINSNFFHNFKNTMTNYQS